VSLSDDREKPGGGYRRLVKVLSDVEMRGELLAQALRELDVWKRKYSEVAELSAIFAEMEKAKQRAKERKQA
jgi:hypothetical protein